MIENMSGYKGDGKAEKNTLMVIKGQDQLQHDQISVHSRKSNKRKSVLSKNSNQSGKL